MPSEPSRWTVGSRVIIRVLTTCSWALAVGLNSPIWDGDPLGPSIFTMDTLIVQIFWICLVAVQGLYICFSACTVERLLYTSWILDAHFAAHNLLHVVFVTLMRLSEFRWAEAALVLDLFNLLASYIGHHSIFEVLDWINSPVRLSIIPRLDHACLVTGPLSWVIVAIYWNGAMMIPQKESLVAAVFGNICIWGLLGVGLFYGIAYEDHSVAVFLSVLSAAIGVGQYRLMDGSSGLEHSMQLIALLVQCSFAFVIMALLFVFTLARLLAKWWSHKWSVSTERELERQKSLPTEKSGADVGVVVVGVMDVEAVAEKPTKE